MLVLLIVCIYMQINGQQNLSKSLDAHIKLCFPKVKKKNIGSTKKMLLSISVPNFIKFRLEMNELDITEI